MHGLVIVDDNGIPLRKAILWNDTRNSIQCRQIEDIYGERLNYNPILEDLHFLKCYGYNNMNLKFGIELRFYVA